MSISNVMLLKYIFYTNGQHVMIKSTSAHNAAVLFSARNGINVSQHLPLHFEFTYPSFKNSYEMNGFSCFI